MVNSPSTQPNPRYWSTDGTIIACIEQNLYKINDSIPLTKLNSLPTTDISGYQCVQFPDEWKVTSKDFEVLLEHVQGTTPLGTSTSFEDIVRLLRITALDCLDIPSIYSLARERLECLIPQTPTPFFKFEHADEALALSIRYNIPTIQKHLYYTLVTTTDIGIDDTTKKNTQHSSLDPSTVIRCQRLFSKLIGHFSPILFTVSTASHMACTDVFAEKWMALVIGPSFADDGVAQPFETLQRVTDIDWISAGLCEECFAEKKAEWRDEMNVVWEKIDFWLEEA